MYDVDNGEPKLLCQLSSTLSNFCVADTVITLADWYHTVAPDLYIGFVLYAHTVTIISNICFQGVCSDLDQRQRSVPRWTESRPRRHLRQAQRPLSHAPCVDLVRPELGVLY